MRANKNIFRAFMAVFRREWRRITSRRIYLGVCVGIPLLIFVFMTTIFGSGNLERLPVAAVDLDNSATSRSILRNVDAVPTVKMLPFTDASAAQEALSQGEIYGYFVIPPNFESDVLGMRSPTIPYYYHFAYMSVGNILMADLTAIFKNISAAPILKAGLAMGISEDYLLFKLMPVSTQISKIGNPWISYGLYISAIFVFVLLQIQILLLTVYSVGIELKNRTSREWLKTAGRNVFVAVTGKLAPYFIIFAAEAIFFNTVMFGFYKYPIDCSIWQLHGLSILFVMASIAFGLLIIGLLPMLRISLSVASLLGSLGATMAGLTFPPEGMPRWIQVMSDLFPIRNFTVIFQNNVFGGLDLSYHWIQYVLLAGMLIPPLFLMSNLKREMIYCHFQEKTAG